jgi:serine-type D-Ala-D-Ala carboxypeptidase
MIAGRLGLHNSFYCNNNECSSRETSKFISSGHSQLRDKNLYGEVHDENTFIMNGISGHAGLFGTARDITTIAQHLLNTYKGKTDNPVVSQKTLRRLWARFSANTDWAYGWHYPTDQKSSAGKLLSPNSLGMTGFTGTSLWIDIDNGIIITLLANRTIAEDSAKMGGEKDRFTELRPEIHNTILGEILK